jgi:hypothetical protein
MKKTIAIILLLAFYSSFGTLKAQDLNDFTRLEAKGEIPNEFLINTYEKIKSDQESNKDEDLDNVFFASTRYIINELLLSGNILFNEELSIYVNKIAEYTLRSETGIYNKLRFYVLKSTDVNAYSTDQGIIFFTTGLLAQVENEAQLAFIIAHEASHYILEHVREGYVEGKEIRSGTGNYERNDNKSIISQLSKYQKENELAADKKGIEIYLKTDYHIDEIFTSFEMLLYSYLPFNEVKFDSTFFNTDILKIPSFFFPDTISVISLKEDYDDEDHSHPNIQTRIDAAFQVLGDDKSNGELKYKISESDFFRIRNLARFEQLNLLLSQREYVDAIYDIFLLKKEFPNNRFLDLCLVKSLYGLSKYKNAKRYHEVTKDIKEIEGESFILHYFFQKIDRQQLSVIAFRHIYDMHCKYPQDKMFERYSTDMKNELIFHSDLNIEDLKSVSFREEIYTENSRILFNIDDSIAKIENSDLSKYEQIRLKKILEELKKSSIGEKKIVKVDFYQYGLSDLVARGIFNPDEDKLQKIVIEDAENKESDNKIVLVDPYLIFYSQKKGIDFEKSGEKGEDFSDILEKEYPKLKLEKTVIDSKKLSANGVEQYNEIGLIFQWMQEVVENKGIDMISSSFEHMEAIEKKYGTQHFIFTNFTLYNYKESNCVEFFNLGLTGLPLFIACKLVRINKTQFDAISLNSASEKIEFSSSENISLAGSTKLIESYLYDLLYRYKKSVLHD